MALTEFCGSPSSISQAEWVNCVRAFAGSRASASAGHCEATAMQTARLRTIFTREAVNQRNWREEFVPPLANHCKSCASRCQSIASRTNTQWGKHLVGRLQKCRSDLGYRVWGKTPSIRPAQQDRHAPDARMRVSLLRAFSRDVAYAEGMLRRTRPLFSQGLTP